MKNTITFFALIALTFTTVSCSTSDDDNSSNGNNSTANQIENTAQSGTWRITYFYDSDQEETGNFSGYAFTFNSNGSLTAVSGNNTVSGTWSVTNSSSSSNDHHFNIFFVSPNNFEDLSDDWDIISTSSTQIKLTDVSGGNGGTDFLTFEKN